MFDAVASGWGLVPARIGAGALILAALAGARAAPAREDAWIEGEVLVRYHRAPPPTGRAPAAADPRRRPLRMASRLDGRPVELVSASGRATRELIEAYSRDRNVESVTPNYLRHTQRRLIPDDPRFHAQWALLNTGQTVNGFTGKAGADIGATRAWPMSRPVTGTVVIAVIDTGVDYRHPDLADSVWINPHEKRATGRDDAGNGYVDDIHGYDFSGADMAASDFMRPPGPDPMDIDGHGTQVAGIAAAAANNATGIAGVAPARLMILKASPDGRAIPLDESLEAMAYAILMKREYGVPVAVINASFGGSGGSNRLERDMIVSAGEAGIVVCAAAGNDGTDNDTRPFYPASYRLSNLVAVAASNARDERAAFSNYGARSVHLAAPGVNIAAPHPLWGRSRATLEQTGGGPGWTAAGIEFSGFTNTLSALVMDCGQGAAGQFPARVRGKIALVERGGGLYFHQKVRNAMDAGAVAVIVYNNTAGQFAGTLVGPSEWIPALSVAREDGLEILGAVDGGTPLALTLSHMPVEEAAYTIVSGTSMATPFVSGALAFMAYQYPDDTPEQRIARLVETAESLPAFAGRAVSGGRLNLARAIDRDADGLPDWWEYDWVGNLDEMDAFSDYDGNGFPDWREYRAGTDPTDPDSALRISAASGTHAGIRRLEWDSVEGRFYDVERAAGVFRDFDAAAVRLPATPPVNAWTDTNAPAADPVLYRVRLNELP